MMKFQAFLTVKGLDVGLNTKLNGLVKSIRGKEVIG